MIRIVAFDLEASSLQNGFPVSIGVARSDGTVYHALVKPHDTWLTRDYEWHPSSAQIHGYSIAQLQAKGRTPAQIVADVNALFQDEMLASDMPSIDTHWLRELVYAAGGGARFDVRRVDLGAVVTVVEDEVGMHGDARREIDRLRGQMHTHNALSDAASWVAAIEAIDAWAAQGKDLRAAEAVFKKWRKHVKVHLLGLESVQQYDVALRDLAKGG